MRVCKHWRGDDLRFAFTVAVTSARWLKFLRGVRARILYEDPPPEFIGWPSGPLTSNAGVHTRSTWRIGRCLGEARLRSVQPSRPRGANLLRRVFFSWGAGGGGARLVLADDECSWRHFRGAVARTIETFHSTSFNRSGEICSDCFDRATKNSLTHFASWLQSFNNK